MKLERFKSILLVLLVISSIVLTVNKWFNEKLWPEGYNFFSDVKNKISGDSSDSKSSDFNPNEEVLKPAKIIINNSGNHVLYTKSSEDYQKLYGEIEEILALSLGVEETAVSDVDEWNNNLKSKSCYFSYPIVYDYGFIVSQISNKYQTSSHYIREFIISYDTRLSSSVYLYTKDAKSDEIKRKRISYEGTFISSLIDNCKSSDEQNYYSFELNFDKQSEDSVDQPITIDSDVLISITQKDLPLINEINIFSNISNNAELYSKILPGFGFNTSTIRRYVENDNSIVFVENYATIKLKASGLLEYSAVDNSMGIALSGDNPYESINSCITFVNTITDMLFLGAEMYYEISSDISDINTRSYTLEFDYYINDNMIVPQNELYNMHHSVIVDVSSGKIVSYRQICKEYISSSDSVECPSAIEAIDSLSSSTYQSGEKITDIFTAYTFSPATQSWFPSWYIENSKGEMSIIPLEVGGDVS